MAQNISLDKIKTKRDSLVENFNSLQDKRKETLKQIEVIDNDLVTIKGAILLCNEWVQEIEPPKEEKEDGGQTNS